MASSSDSCLPAGGGHLQLKHEAVGLRVLYLLLAVAAASVELSLQ